MAKNSFRPTNMGLGGAVGEVVLEVLVDFLAEKENRDKLRKQGRKTVSKARSTAKSFANRVPRPGQKQQASESTEKNHLGGHQKFPPTTEQANNKPEKRRFLK